MHFPLFKATETGYSIGLDRSLRGDVHLGHSNEHMSLDTFLGNDADEVGGVPFRELQPGDWGIVKLDAGIRVVFQFVEPYRERDGIRRVGWLRFDREEVVDVEIEPVER